MKKFFEQAGYVRDEQTGIWASPSFKGIAYSDGDEVEQRLARIICDATDLSVLSDELKQHITDWPSLYHLSSSRANILRPFSSRLEAARVLEIGAGCGAITRYLGESGAKVLALEGSARRAAIARARTRDLPQVEVLAESFDRFRGGDQYDLITLIGVLEYANQFVPGENPALVMLQRARELLKPDGLLVIAIENQLGLKYWAGAPEDHLGVPMYGIEGRYRADQPQTFGRKRLAELLAASGFAEADFLSPLPDYKLPVSVITPSGLSSPDFDAAALASQTVRRDPQLPQKLAFVPELAWTAVMENGLGADLANSFLIAARASQVPVIDPNVLAYHYSTERARGFCKQTEFRRETDGAIGVFTALLEHESNCSPGPLLTLQVPAHTPYVQGLTLDDELVHLVTREGWSVEEVGEFLRRYLDILCKIAFDGQAVPRLTSAQTLLPGICFDLVPQNIIRDAEGRYHVIDREWALVNSMPVGWLLFRTLLLLVQRVTCFGTPVSAFDVTRRGFVLAVFKSIGFEIDDQALDSFAAMESAAQAEALRRPIEYVTNWWADSPLPFKTDESAVEAAMEEQRQRLMRAEQLVAQLRGQADQLTQANREQTERAEQAERSLQQELTQLREQNAQKDRHVVALLSSLHGMRNSKSWKITAPLRVVMSRTRQLRGRAEFLSQAMSFAGGLQPALRKSVRVFRAEGLPGIRSRLSNIAVTLRSPVPVELAAPAPTLPSHVRQRVPYYPNPLWDSEAPAVLEGAGRFAVHCHIGASADMAQCIRYLGAIPLMFDLYVSIAGDRQEGATEGFWKNELPRLESVHFERLPTHAEPLTTMVATFGRALADYSSIVHLSFAQQGGGHAVESLLGPRGSSGGRLVRLLDMLERSAALILGADSDDSRVRTADAVLVQRAAQACGVPLDLAATQWPLHGATAFLVRGSSLRTSLPAHAMLKEAEFGEEGESLLSDALTALLPVFASTQQGRVLQIQRGDSTNDFRHYEDQRDFSTAIVHSDVKVLSYYLPQFHPTPENDEWHGKGFTEWTKVSAANPLFEGHYQQHIPHPDMGYYLLDSPDTLKLQADQMRQAGVHGQVFYHYWFSGRMILEKPAQMLLENPDIAMPYCFCWANENWTRRWDGNEREILLGQTYSADDARGFIRYLIPFFQDSRYIKVGARPMLMVYRPSSIPDSEEYVRIWGEECAKAGVERPYVVAVLTRGATDPADFHMDAGVERVLHDWTDGAVPDIRSSLNTYWPMNGSALSYDEVRDFYMAQNDRKPFDYFRSNVPIWDNTARYGSEALLLHGSTPQSFQRWMEHSIADAKVNLPADRRFVVVNAWNEWAEGAHLEPDTRYGYSYLNSIGRALSGVQFERELNAGIPVPKSVKVHVRFAPDLARHLSLDAPLRRRFFRCIERSSILREQGVCREVDAFGGEHGLALADGATQPGDLHVEFRQPTYFSADVIENMLSTALLTHAWVVCNDYGRQLSTQGLLANGAVDAEAAALASIVVRPTRETEPAHTMVRMRTDAWCFALPGSPASDASLPTVTTIVRFHQKAQLHELRSAISCLNVMEGCVVVPLIAAQDLDDAHTHAVQQMLGEFDWVPGFEPRIVHYASENGVGDLRARMLNESLRQVQSRYAAFLDYDDLLFPDAYAWMLERLRETGKAVAFGRVYATGVSSGLSAITGRRKAFEYGFTYEEFVGHNHAPLHSVLLDVTQLDLDSLVYFDDQRYMEDYLMTLQLFSADNGDWAGLQMNHYVGDYVHSTDRQHTLALDDDSAREALLKDPLYMRCDQRIVEMRARARSLGAAKSKS